MNREVIFEITVTGLRYIVCLVINHIHSLSYWVVILLLLSYKI